MPNDTNQLPSLVVRASFTPGGKKKSPFPRSLEIFGVMPAANLVGAEGVYSNNDKNAKHIRKAANAVHIYREIKCLCLSNSNILLERVGELHFSDCV